MSLRSFFVAPSRARRELVILALAVLFGIAVLPPVIFLAGSRAFGPYAGGGLTALVGNFFRGLAGGSLGFWTIATAPYLAIVLVRLTLGIARRLRTH